MVTDPRAITFEDALREHQEILADSKAAKLLLIDQSGVSHVTEPIFKSLVSFPTSDFLFFISTSTLHRFRDHPAIKLKITRPDDYYHVHRAALDYFRRLIPPGKRYYLSPFAIMKGANIYGLIFGSGHPLGMDKFLRVAWLKDALNGEADYDINRENIAPDEYVLPLEEFKPTKVLAFERALAARLRKGECPSEVEVIEVCFDHGVTRQHAEPVLKRLKDEGAIDLEFRVPAIDRLKAPRLIRSRS